MRWMCSRQAGGEGHLHVRRALMALIEVVCRWLWWPRRCWSGSAGALAAPASESSDTGQRGVFTRFHALLYGPKPTRGVASGPTGCARLCGGA